MKSIKPGRGPSMMGGIVSIFAGLFGVVWTLLAFQISGIFALFGLIFIGIAIVNGIYNFKNATSKNRFSAFDITDSDEEEDPLNRRFGGFSGDISQDNGGQSEGGGAHRFCPYCGSPAQKDFEFCNRCGKKLP